MSTCQVHVEQVVVHVTDAIADVRVSVAIADVRVSVAERGPPGQRGLPGSDGSGSFLLLADRPLGGHRLVAPDGAGGVGYADCTVPTAVALLGMTLHAAATGEGVEVRRVGEVTESSWDWTPELPVYLGVDGVPTQTLPEGAVVSLIVGIPTAPDTLFMAPREPIRLS